MAKLINQMSCIPYNLIFRVQLPLASLLQAYYIYVINEEWDDHNLTLAVKDLPNVDKRGNIIASSVGINPTYQSSYHGEVAWTKPLGDTEEIVFALPQSSVYMLTVPKVATKQAIITALGDATVYADGEQVGLDPTLQISTAERLSVSVVKFKTTGMIGDLGVVSAVLQMHLKETTANDAQVVSVLALPDDWHEEGVAWNNLIFLKKNPPAKVTKTTENFINWWSDPQPAALGYVTIPPRAYVPWGEGVFLRLDVSDAVRKGITQFMLVRVFRFDQSRGAPPSQLPADNVAGTYIFTSKDSANVTKQPTLIVDYEVPPY